MHIKVKLSEITDSMDFQNDEMSAWLNRETGEVMIINDEVLRAVEDGGDPREAVDLYGGDETDIETAQEIAAGKTWIALPSKFDIHDYDIMREFCASQENPGLSDQLLGAIRGSGAFRRFRAAVEQAGILEQWYEYKKDTYTNIARQWCEVNGVECE